LLVWACITSTFFVNNLSLDSGLGNIGIAYSSLAFSLVFDAVDLDNLGGIWLSELAFLDGTIFLKDELFSFLSSPRFLRFPGLQSLSWYHQPSSSQHRLCRYLR